MNPRMSLNMTRVNLTTLLKNLIEGLNASNLHELRPMSTPTSSSLQ